MINVTRVILCGGSGTRLCPLSHADFPKQFLSLTGKESLFHQAAQQLVWLGADDIQVAKPRIVTGKEHRFLVADQLRKVGIELGAVLLEPVGRNTAPALTLAALNSSFKVKRIQIKPKAGLSLQKHHRRAEHWIVVTGTAEITNGNKELPLTENQSTYTPLCEVHRLVSPRGVPLEIIEVQSGSYLGEDGIERLEDTYGRS